MIHKLITAMRHIFRRNAGMTPEQAAQDQLDELRRGFRQLIENLEAVRIELRRPQ
jgi:hypothetical protein